MQEDRLQDDVCAWHLRTTTYFTEMSVDDIKSVFSIIVKYKMVELSVCLFHTVKMYTQCYILLNTCT